jgi:hypothetical protein
MKKISIFGTIFTLLLIMGCSQNLPMSSSLNDFILMGTKTNSSDNIKFEFETLVPDGQMKAFTKNKEKEIPGSMPFTHTEATTFKMMLEDYLSNKFSKFNIGDDVIIKIILKDFWIEQYNTDSDGVKAIQALDTLFNGKAHKSNFIISAKLKIQISITKDGEEKTKMITVTSEGANHAYGAPMSIHGENVNKANNKAIMLINAYFEELGL